MDNFGKVLFAILIIMIFATVLFEDCKEQQINQKQYCELVDLWLTTNGENGHPDYKKVAAEWCTFDHITTQAK